MRRFIPFLLVSSMTHANIASDLDNFFNGIGFASNTTNLQAVESQASGYFGGGSLYARNPVRNYELITLDLPDYRAGCAGIDLFTGSISYISGDKLVNLGKQIMSNTEAYATDVMLATTVPELKQVRDFLQSALQNMNQSTINSCEMAQNLVGGVWPKTASSQQKICNDQLRMGKSGGAHDYVSARMQCAGNGFKDVMDAAGKDKQREKEVIINKNLIWSLLQEKPFLHENTELAELVMSLTGTVIIDKEGHVTEVPSMADNHELIQALLGEGSGSANIWHCDTTSQCLSVTLQNIHLTNGLNAKVRKLIASIDEKIKSDTALSAEEKGFLEMTSLPVMKFLLVLNSAHYGNASVDIESYSALIAQDLLSHYLRALLQEASLVVRGSQFNEDVLKTLSQRIEHAQHLIAEVEPQVSKKLMQKLALIQEVAGIEKQVSATFSGGL